MMLQEMPLQMLWENWNALHLELEWVYWLRGTHLGFSAPQTESDCYIAFWVQRGELSKRSGNHLVSAKKGEWIFQYPGKAPTRWASRTSVVEVAFYLRWKGKGRLLFLPMQKLWKMQPMPNLEKRTLQLYEVVCKNVSRVDFYMRLENLSMEAHFEMRRSFHLWFMTMLEEWRKQGMGMYLAENADERIIRAKWLLDQHPQDEPISVKELAHSIGFSVKHFTMLFLRQYGMAPKQYWMQLKLKTALHELRSTGDTIEQIATRLGWGVSWLHLWVKKETGLTPAQIRRQGNSTIYSE